LISLITQRDIHLRSVIETVTADTSNAKICKEQKVNGSEIASYIFSATCYSFKNFRSIIPFLQPYRYVDQNG
jgi:hypothetical protein